MPAKSSLSAVSSALLLLPSLFHPGEHLTLRLEPLVRVVLQHLLGELPGHGLDHVVGFAGLQQICDDSVPQIVKPESR